MFPRWPPSLCFLFTLTFITSETKNLTHLSRQQLYDSLANRGMLAESQLQKILNVPRMGVSLELLAKDCRSAFLNGRRKSGLYVIQPKDSPPMVVYCDLRQEGGGWTVLQRNTGKNDVFFGPTDWNKYRSGFGNLAGDHWLGNELIYLLTRHNAFTVRFLLMDALGNEYRADYSSFRVDSEDESYALRLGDYFGDAGDAMTIMNETGINDNMKFSTKDQDNDRWTKNCAEEYGGGWWFDSCGSTHLNGYQNIFWRGLCDQYSPCVSSTIMIKPSRKNCYPVSFPRPGDIYPNPIM
ncbi:Hypothetical predicted protein [Pelobates cultripes]|uniref:Fibrinogen C-terminal domain-containing protein n=1 Tax=Pelobates cultripes TaxID=61616 RepID=A0AAD1SND3_PELCU|nr:Hypothetical predicted protein [Pelobates cultripes]